MSCRCMPWLRPPYITGMSWWDIGVGGDMKCRRGHCTRSLDTKAAHRSCEFLSFHPLATLFWSFTDCSVECNIFCDPLRSFSPDEGTDFVPKCVGYMENRLRLLQQPSYVFYWWCMHFLCFYNKIWYFYIHKLFFSIVAIKVPTVPGGTYVFTSKHKGYWQHHMTYSRGLSFCVYNQPTSLVVPKSIYDSPSPPTHRSLWQHTWESHSGETCQGVVSARTGSACGQGHLHSVMHWDPH